MTSYDFLSIYFPDSAELDTARIQEMRSAASTLIRSVYPEIDTSVNSVFGDLFVAPAAPALAAFEVAGNRILSDLDPENVENGIAWNCDFIRQFYLNLGIQDEESQRSYGIVRLLFSDSTSRTIDRSTAFQVGNGIYYPFAPHPGPIVLLPPGEVGAPTTNSRNYSFYGESSWAVDLLLMGTAGQLADAGASVALDRTIDGLTAASALSAFRGGTTPSRIQDLARRVRNNFYSRTPTTRGGATNLVHQQFPEITLTEAVVSGDFEMVRDVQNPLIVAAGCVDLLVRSEVLLQDTVTVRLRQMAGPGGDLVYSGWLDLPETPIRVLSVAQSGTAFLPTIYSASTDARAPRLAAAYGTSERLLMSVPYAEDSTGNPTVRAGVDETGVYADFTVTYEFDPSLKVCQEFLTADENVPAGLSLYCRWYVPAVVEAMEVDFNRKAGTTFNLEQARQEILSAYNSHHFGKPAGPAVTDAALYYAGAHSVNSTDMVAHIRYSVADYVWAGTTLSEPEDQATWEAFVDDCLEVPVTDLAGTSPSQMEYSDTSENSTFAVSGERNVSFILTAQDLRLIERRSV